ncbi:hypothetical protein IGI71_002827 [Enterococcus sp. DIV1279b]
MDESFENKKGKVISVKNMKNGFGKTTFSVGIADWLANYGDEKRFY